MIVVLPPAKILDCLLCYFSINGWLKKWLICCFHNCLLICECVIIFIFLRGHFTLFWLFFFVVMVLLCLSQISHQSRLQTPTALSQRRYSFSLESINQSLRQMQLNSRINICHDSSFSTCNLASLFLKVGIQRENCEIVIMAVVYKIRRCSEMMNVVVTFCSQNSPFIT